MVNIINDNEEGSCSNGVLSSVSPHSVLELPDSLGPNWPALLCHPTSLALDNQAVKTYNFSDDFIDRPISQANYIDPKVCWRPDLPVLEFLAAP